VTLATYGLSADDPSVVIAKALGWLKVDDEGLLLRGAVEPRPQVTTRIPN
jgi:hypothetical protein